MTILVTALCLIVVLVLRLPWRTYYPTQSARRVASSLADSLRWRLQETQPEKLTNLKNVGADSDQNPVVARVQDMSAQDTNSQRDSKLVRLNVHDQLLKLVNKIDSNQDNQLNLPERLEERAPDDSELKYKQLQSLLQRMHKPGVKAPVDLGDNEKAKLSRVFDSRDRNTFELLKKKYKELEEERANVRLGMEEREVNGIPGS